MGNNALAKFPTFRNLANKEIRSLQTFFLYYRETGTITNSILKRQNSKLQVSFAFASFCGISLTKTLFFSNKRIKVSENEFINISLFTCNTFIQCNCNSVSALCSGRLRAGNSVISQNRD